MPSRQTWASTITPVLVPGQAAVCCLVSLKQVHVCNWHRQVYDRCEQYEFNGTCSNWPLCDVVNTAVECAKRFCLAVFKNFLKPRIQTRSCRVSGVTLTTVHWIHQANWALSPEAVWHGEELSSCCTSKLSCCALDEWQHETSSQARLMPMAMAAMREVTSQ
jgi:hypothetical protein